MKNLKITLIVLITFISLLLLLMIISKLDLAGIAKGALMYSAFCVASYPMLMLVARSGHMITGDSND